MSSVPLVGGIFTLASRVKRKWIFSGGRVAGVQGEMWVLIHKSQEVGINIIVTYFTL